MVPEQAERIFHEHSSIGQIYEIVPPFKDIMFKKQADKLDSWMEAVLQLGISEINRFVNGITRDLEAAKNAIALKYNNGLAEGSASKLKVIKWIMYGRCDFELLYSHPIVVYVA